jgi:cysteine synthase B
MIIHQMTDLIGNTPLLKIDPAVTGLKNIDVYAKLEMMNPFGSVKDRTAWGMIKDDIDHIKEADKTIYENSSGNTGKSLQAIASIYGLKFQLVSALANVREQREVMQIQGAKLQEVVGASDCYDPTDPNDPQHMLERTARANPGGVYFTSQFTNERNADYHEQTTGTEIINDLGTVDFYYSGLGTAGSSLGVIRKLRKTNPDCIAIGVTCKSNQFIPGIRSLNQLHETKLFIKSIYNSFIEISSQDAIDGLLTLSRKCGVLCGPSSGASYSALIKHLKTIDGILTTRKKAVFIVCDRMEWYISYLRDHRPSLFGEPEHENSLSRFNSTDIKDVPSIPPATLESWRIQEQPIIIDMRAPDSFDLIHIPRSINMPQHLLEKWIDGHNPFTSGQKVLLICAVGERSRHLAAYLNSLGAQAYNLDGGIMAWRDTVQVAAA